MATGDVVFTGTATVAGYVTAPQSTVTLAGGVQLTGGLTADRLVANGNAMLQPINLPPQGMLTTPLAGVVARAPVTALPVTATATDTDGYVRKVTFFASGVKIGEAAGAPYRVTWSSIPAGVYTLTAQITDNAGDSTTTAPVTFIADAPPTAALTAPATVPRGSGVGLSATATDSDGTIAKVEFYRNDVLVGTAAAAAGGGSTYLYTDATALPPGDYRYTARSYDNYGLFTDSTPFVVTVLATLPYTADFETAEGYVPGAINQQLGWKADSTAAAITAGAAFNGTQSLALAPGTPPVRVAQRFAPYDGHAVVFADFFARPVAEADPAASTVFDVEGARFAFTRTAGNAVLNVFDGDGTGGGTWRPTMFTALVGADNAVTAWTRLTARLDFARKTWDLYAGGAMVAADLGFRDASAGYLGAFAVRGDATTASRVDYIYAGADNPLFADTNDDGIDDAWETAHGLSLTGSQRDGDPDGDGLSNVLEYIGGTDPQDYYNGVPPVVTSLVSGSGQAGANGLVAVRVTRADGGLLVNAPVTISAPAGALLAGSSGGAGAASVTVRTDANGVATAYLTFNRYAVAKLAFGAGSVSVAVPVQPPTTDTNGNGLPDLWETTYFGHVGVDPSADDDGDGISNLQEFQNGTDPSDYYNGVLPQLASQVPADGSLGPNDSIALKVTNPAGQILANAPVVFTAKQGGHHLATRPGGPPLDQVTVRSDANGIATVYIIAP